jgi:hypothetical protein
MAELQTFQEARPVNTMDLDEARLAQQPLIIKHRGVPIAVLVSLDEYYRFQVWQAERVARRAWVLEQDPRRKMATSKWRAQFKAMERFAAHFQSVSPEEMEAEIAAAIDAVRAERKTTARAADEH